MFANDQSSLNKMVFLHRSLFVVALGCKRESAREESADFLPRLKTAQCGQEFLRFLFSERRLGAADELGVDIGIGQGQWRPPAHLGRAMGQ
jgi:hypothetical protein